ncbi:RNA-binding transcriptional accessory protein [Hoyosella sp. G463]|uniref:RNA-binding transcriptional accessory protein n=1 Tax=Lolliginicoccus lacisalsi TaxID=2742202 RepID=A0A927PLL5_9ACTN|nr:RNA-binding transcriptional accessory protein [Lolliginicoccus lacisalsi]
MSEQAGNLPAVKQAVKPVPERIAEELGIAVWQAAAAISLLDDGATVPFVARYRKEATGGLDDAQLRELDERRHYLRELDQRREAILESISAQGKLTEDLATQIHEARTKARLEDIYLPYKTKRRTKAQIAREAGLEPLATSLLDDPRHDPHALAERYVDPDRDVADAAAALEGARAILIEQISEDADLVGEIRELMWSQGRVTATGKPGQDAAASKFADYFDFSEPFRTLPSHRVLALLRGEKEGAIALTIDPHPADPEDPRARTVYENRIAARAGIADQGRPADRWLADTVRWAWRTKLYVSTSIDIRNRLRHAAEQDAVEVFGQNVRDLLLAAPAGARATMGLDPAYRTGVKVAIIDPTGKVLETTAIYPHKPQGQWEQALQALSALVARHGVDLIAIGNGTASRETDTLAAELIARVPGSKPTKIVVSEAGASVYSASAYATRELPELDVSLRGAVSIARRLQDPLAELVKIDPKSIGVGQYQHDVSETLLARSLDAVVEDAVNAVGVDVNTASVPLLARVSGITPALAENIVAHRDEHGAFRSRSALRDVTRLGPKAYEQCAGFLRITGGDDPLDSSAVHPEAYPVVRRIVASSGTAIGSLLGNSRILSSLRPEDFVDDSFGIPTITDILAELEKPGRDPRPEFKAARFAEGVNTVSDLKPGMVLEGTVTNVAAFGAFVDIGVHQDGLVHVSAMSSSFVSDPRSIVRSGDLVRVKVTSVDVPRNRISLTLRLDDDLPVGGDAAQGESSRPPRREGRRPTASSKQPKAGRSPAPPAGGSLADALRKAGYTGRN